jgi:hypothetical protein
MGATWTAAMRIGVLGLEEGTVIPAGLLFHGHDEQLGSLRQFGGTGTVSTAAGVTAFVPERFLPGMAPTPRSRWSGP